MYVQTILKIEGIKTRLHVILLALATTLPAPVFADELLAACSFPADFKLGAVVASKSAPFLGIWKGTWGDNNEIPQMLLVTSVIGKVVKGFYVNGAYDPWRIRAGCRVFTNAIIEDDGTLRINLRPVELTYRIEKNGLTSTYYSAQASSTGSLKRVK